MFIALRRKKLPIIGYQATLCFFALRRKKLPVIVHIHGGAFRQRSGANLPIDSILEEAPDTIIVSINYRLHMFGGLTVLNNSVVPGMYHNQLEKGFHNKISCLIANLFDHFSYETRN